MRRNKRIGGREQGVVRFGRFFGKNVRAKPAQLAAFEGCGGCGLIHKRPTGRIEQYGALAHVGQGFRIDYVLRFLGQGAVQ